MNLEDAINELCKRGVLSGKWQYYLDIHNKVDSLMKSGLSRGRAVIEISSSLKKTPQTIYYALREAKRLL